MKQKLFLILPLFIVSFLVLPNPLSGAVSVPYVVDEKPQVITSDGSEIVYEGKTYLGLENYKQEYVDGYAHLSFTYTHHACCYDNFPPVVYIAPTDPRILESAGAVYSTYHLYSTSNGGGNQTDLYFFSIQFDQTGYTILVTNSSGATIENHYYSVPELTDQSFVALANQHPRSDPPGTGSYSFTPVLVATSTPPHQTNPVIIIPGIMGSALKAGVWQIDPIFHVYDNLIETLENNGYVKNTDLFPFGYDWRKSNEDTAQKLKEKISAVKEKCTNELPIDTDCSKVDIVAHSMGGLVARSYVQSSDYANDVDQLIFLGTPHRGAPKDYLAWEAGEFPPGIIDTFLESHYKKEAKKLKYESLFDYIHGWPIVSIQELLPTYDYLKSATSSQMLNYPAGYPRNQFLEDLNLGLVALLESDIDITNIVGNAGSNTISTIRITDENKLPLWQHGYPEKYDDGSTDRGLENNLGDVTVPNVSSNLGEIFDLEIPSSHINLPTEAEEEIYKELTNKEIGTTIKKSIPLRILYTKVFSPVDIVIIDPDGKQVGKDFATGQEVNEISGAFYSGFETDDEYITIPDPKNGEYKVKIQGVLDGGKFEILTDYIDKDDSVSEIFSDEIAAGEIIEVSLITDTQEDTVFLRLIKPKVEEVAPPAEAAPTSSSRSGSRRHEEEGEVLGASTEAAPLAVNSVSVIEQDGSKAPPATSPKPKKVELEEVILDEETQPEEPVVAEPKPIELKNTQNQVAIVFEADNENTLFILGIILLILAIGYLINKRIKD